MQDNLDTRVIDLAIRLGVVALFVLGTLAMIAPLAGLMIWSVILTVAVYPFFVTLAKFFGGRETLSAVVITLIGLAFALGPVALIIGSALEAGALIERRLASGEPLLPTLPQRILELPFAGDALEGFREQANANLGALLSAHRQALVAEGGPILGRLAHYGLDLLIMVASIVIMGLMFRAAPNLARETRRFANRVFAPHGGHMVDLAGETVRNVSRGIVGVGIVQGVVCGLVLLAFGIKGAGLIAMACLFLSIIQIGPALALVPTIIWAWTAMPTGQAALLTALLAPMLVLDDLLKPVFFGRGLRTPMLVVLIGVVGGVLSHGLLGLFMGPVLLAVLYKMLLTWVDNPDDVGDPDAPAESEPLPDASPIK